MPQAAEWFPSGDWTYQQDGARCHTSYRSIQFFNEHDIPLLPWAANSPDMNPIENIWSLLKKRVFAIGASSKQDLIENIENVVSDENYWRNNCESLIKSMPDRIRSLIHNKGEPYKK